MDEASGKVNGKGDRWRRARWYTCGDVARPFPRRARGRGQGETQTAVAAWGETLSSRPACRSHEKCSVIGPDPTVRCGDVEVAGCPRRRAVTGVRGRAVVRVRRTRTVSPECGDESAETSECDAMCVRESRTTVSRRRAAEAPSPDERV